MCGQICGRWLYGYQHPSTPLFTSGTPPASTASWPSPDPNNYGTVFEAIHLAVVPVINKVIAWDNAGVNLPLNQSWPQRFSVGDPETGQFTNYIVNVPAGYGDLFCSGHCWMPNGKLFVAGGNTLYPYTNGNPTNHFEGSRFVGFWDPAGINTPPNYGWDFSLLNPANLKEMNKRRWYPTVTLISATKVMVSGGSEDTLPSHDYCATPPVAQPDGAFNTYEVFDLAANDWERDTLPTSPPRLYNGPTTGAFCNPVLGQYPRMHLVSTNHIFLSGHYRNGSTSVDHDSNTASQTWTATVGGGEYRGEGASVLVPNVGNTLGGRDMLMAIGGGVNTQPQACYASSRTIDAGDPSQGWSNPPHPMQHGRMTANAVLTPNGDVVVVGGCADFYFSVPVLNPNPPRTPVLKSEVWDKVSGWVGDDEQVSPRMYHSTAALLPSGRIVSAGSDIRTLDWEVYEPRYMANGQTIPQFVGVWALPGSRDVFWGQDEEIQHAALPVGVAIARVVLMRPCSTTHHSDMDQRYVELQNVPPTPDEVPPPNTIKVKMPPTPIWIGLGSTNRGAVTTPPGFYMAFLVTSQGAPSQAKWVKLQ